MHVIAVQHKQKKVETLLEATKNMEEDEAEEEEEEEKKKLDIVTWRWGAVTFSS